MTHAPRVSVARAAQLLLALCLLCLKAPGDREQGAAVDIRPGIDLQTAVDSHPPGTTFLLAPGLYRLTAPIRPRSGDTFIGQVACAPPQTACPAILNGSRVLSSIESVGENFRIAEQAHPPTQDAKHCQPGYPRCIYPQDLYLDGKPLTHRPSGEALSAGSWFFDDSANSIYLRENPSGHVLEVGESRLLAIL